MSERPLFLGISGPSCGGKTTLARYLLKAWDQLRPALLRLDSYYKSHSGLSIQKRARINFDHPEALDWVLLLEHLDTLKRGKTVLQPVYDYENHTRSSRTRPTHSKHLIIVDGIFALSRPIRPRLDLAVYVELADSQCLARRIKRDVKQRGRSAQSVVEQFKTTVQPMFVKYGLPTRQNADLVVSGHDAPSKSAGKIAGLLKLGGDG